MGERSQIEWTDATWNPTTGCTKISTGCDHCYAERLAQGRLRARYLARLPVVTTKAHNSDPFAVRIWPDRLWQPARWRQPRMVFVNSMSDLFHKDIPQPFVRRIFEVMLEADHHIYQVLTKRPARAARFWESNRHRLRRNTIPSHIWIGTSVENQDVEYRVRHLVALPAETRFLSCEPLLGALELDLRGIHWVIAGGESGPEFRPMKAEWAESIRDQCQREDVPFFFKQWGGRTPKAGGRELHGRTWNEYPMRIGELGRSRAVG
ncbi:MAG: phage Gp37/Gp68 family protein [Gammaproteobacteria bacterium]|nr:phage Gp37/Gp68 family protein [Gammaproteobacteria bacterium]MYC50762.1 phage Gp37/Gp68 family protein [Gammaproteobacteria bacterium]